MVTGNEIRHVFEIQFISKFLNSLIWLFQRTSEEFGQKKRKKKEKSKTEN